MILSNDGIKRALRQGALEISPTPSETQYTTSAVDLFLGDGSVIFPPFQDHPWHMLAITRERVHLNRNFRLAARVEGRSSLARIGIIVHLTAPTIHAGFNGKITLELINFGPFHLRMVPNKTQICQLIIEQLESEPTLDINTAFQGQTLPSGEKK